MGNYQRAYTILEVLLVILLIAVWVGVTLPRFGGGGILNKYRLRTTVYNISSDMRSVRMQAINNAGTGKYSIRFDSAPNDYHIISPGGPILETKEIPTGVGWTGTNQYNFYALGNADWSGTGAITFTIASGEKWTIAVSGPTGTVRIQKP